MSKKNAKKRANAVPQPAREGAPGAFSAESEGGVPASRWIWFVAVVLIVSGYAALHKVDPAGKNSWAIVSPALLLSGYLLFIPAIVLTYRR